MTPCTCGNKHVSAVPIEFSPTDDNRRFRNRWAVRCSECGAESTPQDTARAAIDAWDRGSRFTAEQAAQSVVSAAEAKLAKAKALEMV